MYPFRFTEPKDRTKREELLLQTADWVHGLAPFDTFATLTFRNYRSCMSAMRDYERMRSRYIPGVTDFAAVEENPDHRGANSGHHLHVLMCDLPVRRNQFWSLWYASHGVARIVPIIAREHRQQTWQPLGDGRVIPGAVLVFPDQGITVSDYCAKYACKDGTWWMPHVTPWRMPPVPVLDLMLQCT